MVHTYYYHGTHILSSLLSETRSIKTSEQYIKILRYIKQVGNSAMKDFREKRISLPRQYIP